TVLPGAIDTPIWDHAANFSGRALRALTPVSHADEVARAIAEAIAHPSGEVFVPASARAMAALHAVGGGLAERAARRRVESTHFEEHAAPDTEGNLFEPLARGAGVSGGWKLRGDEEKPGGLAVLAA